MKKYVKPSVMHSVIPNADSKNPLLCASRFGTGTEDIEENDLFGDENV